MAINYLSGAGFANSRRMATDTADPALSGYFAIDRYLGAGVDAPVDTATMAAKSHPASGPAALYDSWPNTAVGPQDYQLGGYKWGSDGSYGTGGGTVTWSIAGSGWNNASRSSDWFYGSTVSMSNFLTSTIRPF